MRRTYYYRVTVIANGIQKDVEFVQPAKSNKAAEREIAVRAKRCGWQVLGYAIARAMPAL